MKCVQNKLNYIIKELFPYDYGKLFLQTFVDIQRTIKAQSSHYVDP